MTELPNLKQHEVVMTNSEVPAQADVTLPHLSAQARAVVPQELQALAQWITWKAGPPKQGGKFDKYPCGKDGTGTAWVKAPQWMTFDEAIGQAKRFNHSGIGFVLPAQTQDDNHLVALDFDTVDLSDSGLRSSRWLEINQWCDELDSPYTEISPSGAGVRMLLKSKVLHRQFTGDNPNGGKDEIFCASNKWVTITGNQIAGDGLPDATVRLTALREEWSARGQTSATKTSRPLPAKTTELPPAFDSRPAYFNSPEVLFDLRDSDSYAPAPSMAVVEEVCEAIRKLASTGGTETEWSLGLLNTARFTKEQDVAAHAWSRAHPEYDAAETTRKFDQRNQGVPPTSCQTLEGFSAECAAACKGCSYRGKAANPIHAAQMLSYAKQKMAAMLIPSPSSQQAALVPTPPPLTLDPTDSGNAAVLAANWGGNVMWVVQTDTWFEFDPQAGWSKRTHEQIVHAAELRIRELGAQCFHQLAVPDLKRAATHINKSLNRKGLCDAVALLKGRPGVLVHTAQLDADDWLLGVKGGEVIELRSRICRRQKPGDYVTKSVGCEFHSKATAPLWAAFLLGVFKGDLDRIDYLQRWMGYVLTGSTTAQQLLFAYGLGANGKSVLFNVVQALMGSYATTAPVETFMMSGNEAPKSYLTARLEGARLVVSNETAEGQRLSENIIKELTGGEKIAAAHKYQDLSEFTPKLKLAIVGNHKPSIAGTDNGIWRRIHLLPFNRTFAAHEQDPELNMKLLAELPGILNWALEGCRQWQESGLTLPPVMAAEVQQYQSESDVIGTWISENCIVGPSATAKASALFSDYQRWCEVNGHRSSSSTTFGRRLAERGYTKVKSGTVSWHGLEPIQKVFPY